jgi:hypothetical protein
MNYQTLRDEILAGPLAAQLSPYVVDYNAPKQDAYAKDNAIAVTLNAETGTRLVDDYVTVVDLMSRLGSVTAATILDKLENASANYSVLKWALVAIKSDVGINIGDPETISTLDTLMSDAVLTAEETNAIKQLAVRTSSRAYESVGQPVTAADVSVALRGNAEFTPGA